MPAPQTLGPAASSRRAFPARFHRQPGDPHRTRRVSPGPAPLNPISNMGLRLPDLLSPRLGLGCFSKEQETGFISINLWLALDPNGVTPAALGSSEKPRWRAGRALGWPGSRLPVSRGPPVLTCSCCGEQPEAGIGARPAPNLRPLPVRLQGAWGSQAVGPTVPPPGGQESLTAPLPRVTNRYVDFTSWSTAQRHCTSKCRVK